MKKILFFSLLLQVSLKSPAQLLDSLTLDTMQAYTSLQEAMKNPEKVVKLELRKKKLKAFPTEILLMTNLQYLDLGKNRIKELPAGIDTLKNLQFLLLSRNILTELPPQIGGLSNLAYFNVNQNELESLPAQMGKLEKLIKLDLWSNNVGVFPEELKYMKSLKVLDLRVILISDEQQARLKVLLPDTQIFFSPNCKCQL